MARNERLPRSFLAANSTNNLISVETKLRNAGFPLQGPKKHERLLGEKPARDAKARIVRMLPEHPSEHVAAHQYLMLMDQT